MRQRSSILTPVGIVPGAAKTINEMVIYTHTHTGDCDSMCVWKTHNLRWNAQWPNRNYRVQFNKSQKKKKTESQRQFRFEHLWNRCHSEAISFSIFQIYVYSDFRCTRSYLWHLYSLSNADTRSICFVSPFIVVLHCISFVLSFWRKTLFFFFVFSQSTVRFSELVRIYYWKWKFVKCFDRIFPHSSTL